MGIFSFFSHIKQAIAFSALDRDKRKIVFYSEGRNYWPHLKGLVEGLLSQFKIPICYVTSNKNDPGLELSDHELIHTFLIDEGFVRNWFFENLDADFLVMTMPDLHQYQVKRSKNNVHYIYTQHSLVSFHMVYRAGAFNYFDTIFCSGEHHLKEMRAIEKKYHLKEKTLFNHGYSRLDDIRKEAKLHNKTKNLKTHFLFAPSWGENGTIELGYGEIIIDKLLELGHKVTLRPHPQTIIFSLEKINSILSKHQNNPDFDFEKNVDGQKSLQQSDVMISDWSGAALEYGLGLAKPVIFVDVPKKVNNPNYTEIEIEPFEVTIREKIGIVMKLDQIEAACKEVIHFKNECTIENYLFNIDHADQVGTNYLIKLINELGK